MSEPTLLFVYNADSGKLNALKDYVHKIVKPSTYPCSLCAVTYGNLGMKSEWKVFVAGLGIPTEFLHRDEFCARYDCHDVTYPVAILVENGNHTEFISTEEFDSTTGLENLIKLVNKKLKRKNSSIVTTGNC
jgi:hypothetical protein